MLAVDLISVVVMWFLMFCWGVVNCVFLGCSGLFWVVCTGIIWVILNSVVL